ncbi:hypothetical protein L208DRAFT_1407120 [Tricholoma matsutake]|nr:hypothetical protein L208DRAFT_1407120 [Tricholoma matsutake 945]
MPPEEIVHVHVFSHNASAIMFLCTRIISPGRSIMPLPWHGSGIVARDGSLWDLLIGVANSTSCF